MKQVKLVKPRTIADISSIQETKLGNDLLLDEFGDEFQEDSLAHDTSTPIPCSSYLQTHLRASSSLAYQPPLSLATCPLPTFDDIAHFTLSGATLQQRSLLLSSPSLSDSSFLLPSSKTTSEQRKPEEMPSPALNQEEIDGKLHELLDICRPLSRANIGKKAKEAEILLGEVTEKLQYVKEERNLLKAKLILGFLKEYRKERGRNKTSNSPKTEQNVYIYTPSPAKSPLRQVSISPPKSFSKEQVFPTRTKTPLRMLRRAEGK